MLKDAVLKRSMTILILVLVVIIVVASVVGSHPKVLMFACIKFRENLYDIKTEWGVVGFFF